MEKKCNVIFSIEGYLCFSHEKDIWLYDDNQKPGEEQSEDVLKEENVKLKKEPETYQNKERNSTDYAGLNKSKSKDDSKHLPTPPSGRKRSTEDNYREDNKKIQKRDE